MDTDSYIDHAYDTLTRGELLAYRNSLAPVKKRTVMVEGAACNATDASRTAAFRQVILLLAVAMPDTEAAELVDHLTKVDGKCDRTPVAAPAPQPAPSAPSVEQQTEQRTPADTWKPTGRLTGSGWRTYACDPNCKHQNTRAHREAGVLICIDCDGCVGPLVDPRWRMGPILEKSRNPDQNGTN
jgi:hypothetical protein